METIYHQRSNAKGHSIPRPTSLLMVNNSTNGSLSKKHKRKTTKARKSETRQALNEDEDFEKKEEAKMVGVRELMMKRDVKEDQVISLEDQPRIITTEDRRLNKEILKYSVFQLENGSTEELSTASILARLGVALDQSALVSHKENVMDEPKEEDEKKTEGCRGKEEEGEDTMPGGEEGSHMSSSGTQTHRDQNLSALYHGTWPVERSLWHSGPSCIGAGGSKSLNQDVSSVMSFTSSVGSGAGALPCEASARRTYSQQQLGAKVEMVYSLLSMLGTHDREDMSRTLLAMSSSPDSCQAMRQSGCLPLLVQLLHAPDQDPDTRKRAAQALHNVVHSHPDDKRGRREARVLRLLEQVRDYCDSLRVGGSAVAEDMERHPGPAIAALMKLSFDEEHRHAMCQLGGLHAVAELIQVDHEAHGSTTANEYCVTLRRYAGMALTNLTFGDGTNKALLCSFRRFMRALVAQLNSPSEDLRQVTASVLRNLSWRADGASKQTLREVGAVSGLMRAAMEGKKESTLKSILSALWNLSAHCSINKVDICAVEGALGFLVGMLNYEAPSMTLAIVENAGGILRNISSHIAVREDYREILREHNCLQMLLQQLKSPSLTVVSNACGTLWNLSARCPQDQRALWDLGAVTMLRSLVHSKHKMISMGSSAALKNLLGARPDNSLPPAPDPAPRAGLYVRKRRALEQELDETLAETCDNIEVSGLPTPAARPHRVSRGAVSRSDSRDSVTSTLSDSTYERVSRAGVFRPFSAGLTGSLSDPREASDMDTSERRFLRRYCNSIRDQEEGRKLLLQSSNEDNTLERQSSLSADAAFHRLGQIEETRKEEETATKGLYETGVRPRSAFSPLARAKFSDLDYDEDASQDQPVNYSLQYVSEVKEAVTQQNDLDRSYANYRNQPAPSITPSPAAATAKNVKMNVVYGDYAETDLDQPTDYSLKYAEGDDEPPKQGYFEGQDTLKTYCTEGTPYETPCNFSTATSMSDLNCEQEAKPGPTTDYNRSESVEENSGTQGVDKPPKEEVSNLDKEERDKEPQMKTLLPATPPAKRLQSELSSGLLSPEKPVQWCEEGTPGYFSRVSSLSSLSSIPAPGIRADSNLEELVAKEEGEEEQPPRSVDREEVGEEKETEEIPEEDAAAGNEELKEEPRADREGKVVTFGGADHYAEETPLMFSRCSSLGSLSSFEQLQASIHDDRSSVISDFSRRTSGVVSPSELPDSPTQTVPPSPKPPLRFTSRLSEDAGAMRALPRQPPGGTGVFEDEVATFKQEDTPVEFSRGTSLSSLTIDDEPKICNDAMLKEVVPKPMMPTRVSANRREREEGMEKQDTEKEKRELSDCCELAPVSEGEEETDEDMLAACINIGMQNSRQRQCQYANKSPLPRQDTGRAPGVRPGRPSGIPVKATNTRQGKLEQQGGNKPAVELVGRVWEDTVQTFCTEGTPANISHAGSHSDLSVLSFPCEGSERHHIPELSDDSSSNLSGDNDNILAECIQSGMPKARSQMPKRVLQPPTPVNLSPALSEPQTPPKKVPPPRRPIVVPQRQAGHHHLCGLDHGPPRKPVHVPRTSGVRTRPMGEEHSPSSVPAKPSLPQCLPARDELETYATEGSPRTFSSRSSLSDLTVNSAEGAVASCLKRPARSRLASEGASCDAPYRFATEDTPLEVSHAASLSSLSLEEGEPGKDDEQAEVSGHRSLPVHSNIPVPVGREALHLMGTSSRSNEGIPAMNGSSDGSWQQRTNSASEDVVTILSRNGSLSSLSVDSFGSTEPTPSEQALLEQCINSGMPKSKAEAPRTPRPGIPTALKRKPFPPRSMEAEFSRLTLEDDAASKNVPDPSAAPTFPAADVDGDTEGESLLDQPELLLTNTGRESPHNHTEDLFLSPVLETEENMRSSGASTAEKPSDRSPTASTGASPSLDSDSDSKVRDGDAMMASLDKMTEDLLQQTRKGEKDLGIMKRSAGSNNTWNEDTSPNDVSFPSLSTSAPLIQSFHSDNREPGGLPELTEEEDQLCTASLTDSHLLEEEAGKMALAVRSEAQSLPCLASEEMEHSMTSLNSNDIDAIKPPSMMGSLVSLTMSVSGQLENVADAITSMPAQARNGSSQHPCRHSRKKSLPVGMMVRRALGNNNSNHNGSLENLPDNNQSMSSSCNSNLDHIKPPSAMEEVMDMENSMVSVASITSEVADSSSAREHTTSDPSDAIFDLMRPVACVMADVYLAQHGGSTSISDCLENVGPPSAFDELTDRAAACDPGSETICSDTEMCTEDPPSDGSRKTTPVPSDHQTSSAESTPKKLPRLTPKQRRHVAKERYQTYTITAEEERQLEDIRRRKVETEGRQKMTPKQRRQENRQRFETRVLDIPEGIIAKRDESSEESPDCRVADEDPDDLADERPSPRNKKTLKQKRAEAKERFRTRTLGEEDSPEQEVVHSTESYHSMRISCSMENCSMDSNCRTALLDLEVNSSLDITSEEMETMLQHDSNIIISTLIETGVDPQDDMLLDCETLSLISIESESEHNSLNTCRSRKPFTLENSESFDEEPEADLSLEEDLEESDEDQQTRDKGRPRIVKPGASRDHSLDSNNAEESPEQVPKGIRGKRKALYSSPAGRRGHSPGLPKPPRGQSSIPVVNGSATKNYPTPRPTRASSLRQSGRGGGIPPPRSVSRTPPSGGASPRNTSPRTNKTIPTRIKTLGRNSSPRKSPLKREDSSSNPDPKFKPPERQGTFTKDEPVTTNLAPTSPTRTRIPMPATGTTEVNPDVKKPQGKRTSAASKLPVTPLHGRTKSSSALGPATRHSQLTRTKSQDSPSKPAAPGSAKKAATIPGRIGNARTSSAVGAMNRRSYTGGEMKNSLSNQSLQGMTANQRSNSNCSLSSVASNTAKKLSVKKEVTSKIASLWKKVEASKNKQKGFVKKDTRVWIMAEKSGEKAEEDQSPPKLLRSSTFNGCMPKLETSEESGAPGTGPRPKTSMIRGGNRNSTDLTGYRQDSTTETKSSKCGKPLSVIQPMSRFPTDEDPVEVVMRRKKGREGEEDEGEDATKRLSRLGSFIRIDPATENGEARSPSKTSAIVQPFNYNPPPRSSGSQIPTTAKNSDIQTNGDVGDLGTGSRKVTSV